MKKGARAAPFSMGKNNNWCLITQDITGSTIKTLFTTLL